MTSIHYEIPIVSIRHTIRAIHAISHRLAVDRVWRFSDRNGFGLGDDLVAREPLAQAVLLREDIARVIASLESAKTRIVRPEDLFRRGPGA